MMKIATISLAVVASILGSIGAMYFKKASENFELRLKTLRNPALIAGLALYFFSAATIILLLKFNDISYIYPLTALTYVFVAVLSWKYLDEKINIYKSTAIALIIMGVTLVAIS